MMVGTYHSGADSLGTAIEAMNAALKIWEQLGEKQRWKETLSLVTTMNVYHSDLKAAYRGAEQLHQTAVQERNDQFRFWALVEKAMALQMEGKLEEAHAALDDALSGGLKMAPVDQIWHGGVLARVLLEQGQFEEAVIEADKVAAVIAASQPTAFYVMSPYSAVTEVFLAGMERGTAHRDDFRKRAWKSINKLKAFTLPFPIAKARLNLLLGRYYALTGKTSAVLPALRKSLEEAERLNLRHDRALAHLELGKHVKDAAERREHQEAAKALFAESGAEVESKRIVVE